MVQEIEVGDKIIAEIEVKNTGKEDYEFTVKVHLAKVPTGEKFWSDPKYVSIDSGRTKDVEFEITISNDMPKGQYKLRAYVYKATGSSLDGDTESYVCDII